MKRMIPLMLIGLAFAFPAMAKPHRLPDSEWKMIRQVAVNYDLDDEQTWLLAAIRVHENGRAGLEFGVGGPMNSGHPAHRYRDGVKSFYIQAMWAAGTIRKYYRGDIWAFGRRYNAPHAVTWSDRMSLVVVSLKTNYNHRLPGVKPAKRPIKYP